mgnify:FL=1
MIDLNQRSEEKKNFFNRIVLIYIFFGFLFSLFLYRTFTLQISSYTDYELASTENKTKEMLIQPRRGIIYDRNGEIIVNNVPSYNLITKPSQIDDIESYIEEIKVFIDISDDDFLYAKENHARLAKLNRELILKKNLTLEEIARFDVRRHKFPNTYIDERYSRFTIYPELFSHAVGYVGNLNDDGLEQILSEQNLKPRETIFAYSNGYIRGMTGLENIYDKTLRGTYGKKVYEVDASGKLLNEIEIIPSVNGKDLYTSLDIGSQKVAFDQLNNRRGAVVAVEIDTGAIVTYVSSPSFPLNRIANGMSSNDFDKLLNDNNKPFFDRAGQGRYSPASTIKPAIGLFGIENEIIDWNFTINDPGFFILPEDDRVYRGWKKGGHGEINLEEAIIESSNTFFFSLAYESEIEQLIEHLFLGQLS